TLFTQQDIDQPKVPRAEHALQQRRPQGQIEALQQSLRASNLQQALAGCDLVVGAADNFAVTYQLSDACMQAGMPLLTASV
ncbi:ThiF family adenylyltransferase, partial [Pantoea sp. GbtcB22]|uniref:HesA/MoeB/ThiF family protein n=1 Tax=Pantoea sp. GbtcB22 TaxID=2824767 RepID=UPI001C306A82